MRDWCKTEGIRNKKNYVQIAKHGEIDIQLDSDPKHTSIMAIAWLNSHFLVFFCFVFFGGGITKLILQHII